MKNLLLYFILFLDACDTIGPNSNNDYKNNSSFFEDIDIYNLKGIREIKVGKCNNCIEFENVNDSLCRITYHDSIFAELKTCLYRREFNYWWCRYESGYDSCGPIVYEYILPTEIIELTYCKGGSSIDSTLLFVDLFKDSLSVSYALPNGFHCIPEISVLRLAETNSQSVFTQVMNLREDTVTIYETSTNNLNDTLRKATSCWKSKHGNRSYYWWSYFKWGQQKIGSIHLEGS